MRTFRKKAVPPAGCSRSGSRSGLCAALSLAALLAGACAPTIDNNGNMPLPESLSKIQVGKTTQQQVTRLLGSPSTQAPFAKNRIWYYIGMRTETVAFLDPEVLEHKVLEIDFDERGIVKSVEHIDATKARKVEIVQRETPTTGRELTLIEQLIGNVGRFGAAGGPGS